MNDRHLLSGCVSGDERAAEMLVRHFSGLVYTAVQHTLITRHVSYTDQDLEDIHNTVFLKLFERGCRKLRQFEGRNGCSLASWIRLVTVRTVLNMLRKRGMDGMAGQRGRIALDEMEELRDTAGPTVRMEERERRRAILNGIDRLPARDRLFLRLHIEKDLPIAEVAEAMHLTLQAAYTLKHRAVQRLKGYVAGAEPSIKKNEPKNIE